MRHGPPSTSFSGRIASINGLDMDRLGQWAFHPGMLFGSIEKWWDRGSLRSTPHEGIDLYAFISESGKAGHLEAGALVPVVWPGSIVTIIEDFIGLSVFVSHEIVDIRGKRLYSIYGHVRPYSLLQEGSGLDEEAVVAVLAGLIRPGKIPPHLHLSLAWVSDPISPGLLSWKTMRDPELVELIDPLPYLSMKYRMIDHQRLSAV